MMKNDPMLEIVRCAFKYLEEALAEDRNTQDQPLLIPKHRTREDGIGRKNKQHIPQRIYG